MRALIAMSGGVDSSVAACLMQEQGYECIGCTMKLFDNADAGISAERPCCSLEDAEDARGVANRLGIPFYVFNYRDEFRAQVMQRFADAYRHGLTPNPCVDCNRYLKFGRLYERARALDCDVLVTGHYARIERAGDRFVLKKALSPDKDQSYVLYCLTQEQLAHTAFPLGGISKDETRAIAASRGFLNANKSDSQDICFAPDGDYARVVEELTGPCPPGDYVDPDGRVVGRHKGIIRYTLGQHRGLGIALGKPTYVLAIRPETNQIVVGDNDALFSREVFVRDFNWIAGEPPAERFRCLGKLRYRHREQPAEVTVTPDGVRLVFDEPQRAVTPGQSAVLYDGDVVLGGGVIAPLPQG